MTQNLQTSRQCHQVADEQPVCRSWKWKCHSSTTDCDSSLHDSGNSILSTIFCPYCVVVGSLDPAVLKNAKANQIPAYKFSTALIKSCHQSLCPNCQQFLRRLRNGKPKPSTSTGISFQCIKSLNTAKKWFDNKALPDNLRGQHLHGLQGLESLSLARQGR